MYRIPRDQFDRLCNRPQDYIAFNVYQHCGLSIILALQFSILHLTLCFHLCVVRSCVSGKAHVDGTETMAHDQTATRCHRCHQTQSARHHYFAPPTFASLCLRERLSQLQMFQTSDSRISVCPIVMEILVRATATQKAGLLLMLGSVSGSN